MKFWRHLKTINHHKWLVLKHCFRAGIYRQGILHDLSKYSPVEFLTGVRYYQDGTSSPNNGERRDKGYSAAWLHHKGRNKHHIEYWIDYTPCRKTASNGQYAEPTTVRDILGGGEMPLRYVIEMFCDRVAASKNYKKNAYTDSSPWEYYLTSRDHYLLHPNTAKLLETLLLMLKEDGEDAVFAYIRTELLHKR